METSNESDSELSDSETCSTSNKLSFHDDQLQKKSQSDENNDVASIEVSDSDSEDSLLTMNSRSVNGTERNLSWDKKLVVELCDLMVCSRKNCDIPDYQDYRIREQMQEHKKRKVDQQNIHSRKKPVRYKDESDDDDTSDVVEVTNVKKVFEVDESSNDDVNSDIVEVSNDKNDPDFKEETSDEEISFEEADDSDWEEENIPERRREQKKKKKLEEMEKQKKLKEEDKQRKKEAREKKAKSKGTRNQTENLSSFELVRQKHLDDKMAFLKSLMIDEIVDELEETAKSQRKPRVLKPKVILEVSRKSKRVENVKLDYSEQALEAKVYNNPTTSTEKPELPYDYSFEDAFYGDKSLLHDFDEHFMNMEIKEEVSNTNSSYNLDCFDSLVFKSCAYPFTLSSIAFHPAVDRTIILAGSIGGQISLWNTNTEPYCFTPHAEHVTLIKVNPECPSQIFSASYDGTIRQTDIENKCFIEVFKEEESQFKYFDFISPSEFLVAQSNGYVSMIDSRERRSRSGSIIGFHTAAQWKCSSKAIRTISAHPIKKDLCLSLDTDGSMKVWDRRFQKQFVSYVSTNEHVLTAFLSPVTGNSILCSSKLVLSIYNSSHLEKVLSYKEKFFSHPVIESGGRKRKKHLKPHNTLHHSQSNYFTMANWLPKSDSAFIVSNNVQKNTIIMDSNDGRKLSSLNYSKAIIVFQEVHPVHNMLAVTLNVCQDKSKISKIHLYLKEIHT